MTAPDANWIDYKPGDPIPTGRVDARLRSGLTFGRFFDVHEVRWDEFGNGTIIAYLPEKALEETEAERLARCAPELVEALKDLLDQVESLDDFTLSRDLETYKAEACWEDALRRARQALKNAGIEL